MATRFANELRELFGWADIKIHLDGKQAAEKQKARSEREAVRAKKLVSLNEALTTMERNSDKGVWTSRNVMRRIDNGLRGIFQLTAQEKEDLVGGLTLGFDVCQCTTEADVCIGFSAPGSITISGDSDLLAYKNITTVIRPIPKQRRKFAVYENNNDYNTNINGIGPIKSLRIVKSLKEDQDVRVMVDDYTRQAQSIVRSPLDPQVFEAGIRVFGHGNQTPVDIPESTEFQPAIQRLIKAKAKRAEVVREHRESRDSESRDIYVSRGSKRNQFRPIFQNQNQILAGTVKTDIRTSRTYERPPRRSPRRKRPQVKEPTRKKKHDGKKPRNAKKGGAPTRSLKDATKHDHMLRTNHPYNPQNIVAQEINNTVLFWIIDFGQSRWSQEENEMEQLESVLRSLTQ
ncbi:hypothetical protein BGX31_010409 [Mortierella sp. GBA43]|nr:hypothetical protein BGX31_010409 [Mortierella sp. GBA43]